MNQPESPAVRAAKKWFADAQRYVDGIVDVEWHPIKQATAQAHLDDAIQRLAAIIEAEYTAESPPPDSQDEYRTTRGDPGMRTNGR